MKYLKVTALIPDSSRSETEQALIQAGVSGMTVTLERTLNLNI